MLLRFCFCLCLAASAGSGCGGGTGTDAGIDAGDAGPPGCDPDELTFVPYPAPSGATRFALSLYHFNLQYVAGGLEGFPLYEMSEEEVEDAIIVESFEPLLDMLVPHQTWSIDLELQGLMIDVMAARHPEVLNKLRGLVANGQVELQSAHWSDQLVTAWPKRDLEWSLERTHRSAALGGKAPVEVRFPRTGTAIATAPSSLEEAIVRHDEAEFTFAEAFLPLASGAIELGPGRFLIKDTRSVHLAAGIGSGGTDVVFRDETLPGEDGVTFRFFVVDGSDADVLAKADRLNVHPVLVR